MPSPVLLFVGGGSLGHVLPSLAVADAVSRLSPDSRIVFVCANRPNEIACLTHAGLRYHVLRAPKSPYGFSVFIFPFQLIMACVRARKILLQEKPDAVFAKGGSISVPMCLVAKLQGIPVVLHESDSVLSAATKFIATFAAVVCIGFPDPQSRASQEHTGSPVRSEIFEASEAAGQRITGFSGKRPVVMILGGSQGSVALNEAVRDSLETLIAHADIIHLTGIGKQTAIDHARYFARQSVGEELPHLYALSDVVVSRAGIGVLSELAALKKAVIVVPLTGVGHDHQLRNAELLQASDSIVLMRQEQLSALPQTIESLLRDDVRRKNLGESLHRAFPHDAAQKIATILLANVKAARIQS